MADFIHIELNYASNKIRRVAGTANVLVPTCVVNKKTKTAITPKQGLQTLNVMLTLV